MSAGSYKFITLVQARQVGSAKMTSKTHGPDRRNDKSEYQKRTCEMDKSLNRGMCIKFESRKICIARNHFDNSDLEIHNTEHKKLPD